MGLFDSLKRQAESAIKREVSQGINKAVNNAAQSVAKGRNYTETFTFASLPTNVAEISGDDLFSTNYPWFCNSALLSDGSIITIMTEEREDKSATELVVFTVKGF